MIRLCARSQLKLLLVLVWLLANVVSTSATTVVIPSDTDMIVGSRAVVRAKVLSVASGRDNRRIFTYITLRVREVFKGEISVRRIVLKEEGGTLGDEGSVIFGTPQFSKGEEVFLYLDTRPDGSFRVHQMFLGKFSVVEDPVSGVKSVVRSAPDGNTMVLGTHSHGASASSADTTNQMELSAYAELVRRNVADNRERSVVFEEKYYQNIPVRTEPVEYAAMVREGSISPQFTFLSPSQPARWFEPDSGSPVLFELNAQGAPSAQIIDDIEAAMNAWSTVPGCSLRVARAPSTGACYQRDSNTIVFDNCDSWFAPSPGCSGILARGGFSWTSQSVVINGTQFFRAHTGHVSFNPFASCSFSDNCVVREIATHELGHALGLGHSQFSESTMFGIAHFDGRCASLRPDDMAGISFIYPGEGGSGPLTINTTSPLGGGIVGTPHSQSFVATGGTFPYTWSHVTASGPLPTGLNLTTSGVLNGTPGVAGTFTFTLMVTDAASRTAQHQFSITIGMPGQEFNSQFVSQIVPSNVEPGQAFNATLKWNNIGSREWNGAAGFRIVSQNPPNNRTWGGNAIGVPLVRVNPGGQLDLVFTAFAPLTPGRHDFQWQLAQDGSFFGEMSSNVTIQVGVPPPEVSTSTLEVGEMGAPFSQQLSVSGGTGPFMWSVMTGALPDGVSLDASSGRISGTPAVAGTFAFTVRVTDSRSTFGERALSLLVNPPPPPLAVLEMATQIAEFGIEFNLGLGAIGGTPPYSWSLESGDLPPGLALSANGSLTGMPTTKGNYTFSVTVRDLRSRVASGMVEISVVDPIPVPVITKVKYKRGGRKLVVRIEQLHTDAVLLLDGVVMSAKNKGAALQVKKLSLSPGEHTVQVINPANKASEQHTFSVK